MLFKCFSIKIIGFFLFILLYFTWQSTSLASENNLKFSLKGEYGQYQSPKRSYLGTTPTLTGPFTYGLVRPENHALLRTVKIELENNIPSGYDLIFSNSIETGRATQSDNIGFINLGGESLIIGGAKKDGSFLLADGGVGASADVSNTKYKFDYQFYEVNTKIQTAQNIKYSSISLKPFIGLSYRYSSTQDRFKGDVIDFSNSFSNSTNIRIQTLSPAVGLNTVFPLNRKVNFINNFQYAYNFNWGRGSDKVSFTGQPTQVEKMKNNNGTHSFGVSTGFDYKLNNSLSFGISGNYERLGNAPTSKLRDNLQESDFDYENADVFSGSLNLTYKF